MRGQLILPPAPQRVTSRELRFTVGDAQYSEMLAAEDLLSVPFDVIDGDEIAGSLIDVNRWGKPLPRRFAIQVAFPLASEVSYQPWVVELALSYS